MTHANRPNEAILKQLGTKLSVRVWEQSSGHMKVQDGDGQIVNYWPDSKKRTCHIQGTSWTREGCEPMDVLRLAVHGAEGMKKKWDIPLDRVQGEAKTPRQVEKLESKQKLNNDVKLTAAQQAADQNGEAPWA